MTLDDDDGARCDIMLVKMKPDGIFNPQTGIKIITAESDDRENYIAGLKSDGS